MAEAGKKRRFHHQSSVRNPPKRGAKGILLTCEVGRENKCKREGLEILKYDWETQLDSSASRAKSDEKLTLDEEIAALKNTAKSVGDCPFTVYETGCHGTVFVLYTGGAAVNDEQSATKDDVNDDGTESNPKKSKPDDANKQENMIRNGDKSKNESQWDSVKFLCRVVEDMKNEKRYPSSRFITRMIPIEATSSASIEDIQNVIRNLIKPIIHTAKDVASSKKTFAIIAKRRLCDHLKRDQIIKAVGETVADIANQWKVNLNEPDYRIIIEVCKNIAGVSVIATNEEPLKNFNVAELREKLATSDEI